MDCASQIKLTPQTGFLETIAQIYELDKAWLRNAHSIITNVYRMEPFENIISQTIERFYIMFRDSNGNPKFRIVVFGLWTVDLKKMLLKLTEDPDNSDHYRIVLRANTHRRPRVDDSRFNSPITVSFLALRSMTEEDDWDKG